jgi:hypothetical protein
VLLDQGCVRSQEVRSIAVPHAFVRRRYIRSQSRVRSVVYLCVRPYCVRSQCLRSIADNCLWIPTTHALKRWSIGSARATRGLRLMWSVLNRGLCARLQLRTIADLVRSNARPGAWYASWPFLTFKPRFHDKDLQHNITLKQHKTWDINTTKSITNIS